MPFEGMTKKYTFSVSAEGKLEIVDQCFTNRPMLYL